MIVTELAADFENVRVVERLLYQLDGVRGVRVNKEAQTILVEGTLAPSVIQQTLQSVIPHVIVRGTSASDREFSSSLSFDEKAAVCIFDTNKDGEWVPPQGLIRFIQTSTSSCFLDISFTGLPSNMDHYVAVHEVGRCLRFF